jgi:anti-anti-sigma factor
MAPFSVRSEAGVVYLSGVFDLASVPTFTEETSQVLVGHGDIVLDLADVASISSSGVLAILSLARCVGGRRFVLRRPQPHVAKVFDMMRLADVPGIEIDSSGPGDSEP